MIAMQFAGSPSFSSAVISPFTIDCVAASNSEDPVESNSIVTTYPAPFWFNAVLASFTLSPVSITFPSAVMNVSWAVVPIDFIADSASSTPGSSTLILFSPSIETTGLVRPISLTLFSMTA